MSYGDIMLAALEGGSSTTSTVNPTTKYQMDSSATVEFGKILQKYRDSTLTEWDRRAIEDVKAQVKNRQHTAKLVAELEETQAKNARTAATVLADILAAQLNFEGRVVTTRDSATGSMLAEGVYKSIQGTKPAHGLKAMFGALGEAEKTAQFSQQQLPGIMQKISRQSEFGGLYTWEGGVSKELMRYDSNLALKIQSYHEAAKAADARLTDTNAALNARRAEVRGIVNNLSSSPQGDEVAPEVLTHALSLLQQSQALQDEKFGLDPSTMRAEYEAFLKNDKTLRKMEDYFDKLLAGTDEKSKGYSYGVALKLQNQAFRDWATDRGYNIGTVDDPAAYTPSRADNRAVMAWYNEKKTGRIRGGGRTGELVSVSYNLDPNDVGRYQLKNTAMGNYAYIEENGQRQYKTQAEVDELRRYAGARPTLKLVQSTDERGADRKFITEQSGDGSISRLWEAVDGQWVEIVGDDFPMFALEIRRGMAEDDDVTHGWLTEVAGESADGKSGMPVRFPTAADVENSESVESDLAAWKTTEDGWIPSTQGNWSDDLPIEYTNEPPHGQTTILGRRKLTSAKDQAEFGSGAVTVVTAGGVVVIPESRQSTVTILAHEGRDVIGPAEWIRRRNQISAGYKAEMAQAAQEGRSLEPTKWSRGLTSFEDHSGGMDRARARWEGRYRARLEGSLGEWKQQKRDERLRHQMGITPEAAAALGQADVGVPEAVTPEVEPVAPVEAAPAVPAVPAAPAEPTIWKDAAGHEYRYTPETGAYDWRKKGSEDWQAVTKPDAIKEVRDVFKGDVKPWDAPPPTAAVPEAPEAPEAPAPGDAEWIVPGKDGGKSVAYRHAVSPLGSTELFYYKPEGADTWERVPTEHSDLVKGTWDPELHGKAKPWDRAIGPDELVKIEEQKERHPLVKWFLETPAGTRKERRADKKALAEHTKEKSKKGEVALSEAQERLREEGHLERVKREFQQSKDWQDAASGDIRYLSKLAKAERDKTRDAIQTREHLRHMINLIEQQHDKALPGPSHRPGVKDRWQASIEQAKQGKLIDKDLWWQPSQPGPEGEAEKPVEPIPKGSPTSSTADDSLTPGVNGHTERELAAAQTAEEAGKDIRKPTTSEELSKRAKLSEVVMSKPEGDVWGEDWKAGY